MKRLAALAVVLLSSAASSFADYSRFWDYYEPYPSNYIGSREWWEGDTLLGDFWGARNWLDANGLEITATYANNIAGNVTGGKSRGFTYADNTLFGAQADMGVIAGLKGLSLTVSGLNRAGRSLSADHIGNQFTVQQIYGGSTVMFYGLYFEQKMFDDRIALKAGRFAAGDEFASSPIYWLYMNNGIDGNPQALPVNSQFSAYPWAVWAARLSIRPTKEFETKLGIFQVSNRIFDPGYHGVDFSIHPGDSVMLIAQTGWYPEFFQRPVSSAATNEGKAMVDGKSTDKKAVAATEMKGYPGHYWFGAYYSPYDYSQFGTTQKATDGAYGFYAHADQMVFQEAPGSDQGLTVWSAAVFSPQQNIARLPLQINGGLAYKGLIPTRDEDYTTFGVVYGKFSRNYARNYQNTTPGGGYPQFEVVLEAGYKIQINKFMFLQPDIQYVINPGGTGDYGNALVLGAQMGVTF